MLQELIPLTKPTSETPFAGLKVAVVHDWLNGMRGGEKVLEAICALLPQADIYTLIHDPARVAPELNRRVVATSFLQAIPGIQKRYRYFLPLMPAAIESLTVDGYDLVVSSSHCVAKGVRVGRAPSGRRSLHVCYCHTPMRYIYDQFDSYFPAGRKPLLRWAARLARPWLTSWDRENAAGVDRFVANSETVRDRIATVYERDSVVVYPPVDTDFFTPAVRDERPCRRYFLVAGALVPYKRVDLAIWACRRLGAGLKIVGIGNDRDRLRRIAAGADVEFLGWVAPKRLRALYRGCEALLFPQEEDFGIAAVEAMACGRPVVAYARGGGGETVVDGVTGTLFHEQSARALADAITRLRTLSLDPEAARLQALKFDAKLFADRLGGALSAALAG